ncbi:hypothetical protein K1719_021255 [Acacia pycnantha]|nr:hypothetical protein K1719_021255 [Acacia pycnantha]
MNSEQGNGDSMDKVDGDDVTESKYPVLSMTEQQYTAWCRPWMNSLIIKVLGLSVPKHVLFDRVRRMWKPQQPLKVIPLSNEYYVVSFSSKEDRDYAYHEGPWMIDDHYLIVQRWRPNFNPWKADCQRRIAVWVRIPDLPMEFCTVESLGIIGNMIGKIIKIDRSTSIYDKGAFSRICVEVDLHKPLLPAFTVFGEDKQLVWEGGVEYNDRVGEESSANANRSKEVRPLSGTSVDGRGKDAQGMGVGGLAGTKEEHGRGGKKVMRARSSGGMETHSAQNKVGEASGSVAAASTVDLSSGTGQNRYGQGAHLGPQMILRREMRRPDALKESTLGEWDFRKTQITQEAGRTTNREGVNQGMPLGVKNKPRGVGKVNKNIGKARSHGNAPSVKEVKPMALKNNFSILQEPKQGNDNLMHETVPFEELGRGSLPPIQPIQVPLLVGNKDEGVLIDGVKDAVMITEVPAQQ